MRRRDLLAAAAGAATWPAVALPQQHGKLYRIGVLWPGSAESSAVRSAVFRSRLRALGYIEDSNVTISDRFAEGQLDRLPALARELVGLNLDVIVASSVAPTMAAREAMDTIPIVMLHAGNPIGLGLIQSLARPGGNVTGTTSISEELGGKQLEILHEIAPKASHIAFIFIFNPTNSAAGPMLQDVKAAADKLSLQIIPIEVLRAEDLDAAFTRVRDAHAEGLLVFIETVTYNNRRQIIDFAAQARLPALYTLGPAIVPDGGLVSTAPASPAIMTGPPFSWIRS